MIEVMKVTAIISILTGILLTAVQGVRTHARRTKARHDVDQVTAAWLTYLQEYRRFPLTVTITNMGPNAVAVLNGSAHADNHRRVIFMDFGSSTTHFPDPWGTDYQMVLDSDGDNKVTVPGGNEVYVSVGVWSVGPDKTADSSDDVRSWSK